MRLTVKAWRRPTINWVLMLLQDIVSIDRGSKATLSSLFLIPGRLRKYKMVLVKLLATAIKYIMMNYSVEIPGDLLLL